MSSMTSCAAGPADSSSYHQEDESAVSCWCGDPHPTYASQQVLSKNKTRIKHLDIKEVRKTISPHEQSLPGCALQSLPCQHSTHEPQMVHQRMRRLQTTRGMASQASLLGTMVSSSEHSEPVPGAASCDCSKSRTVSTSSLPWPLSCQMHENQSIATQFCADSSKPQITS